MTPDAPGLRGRGGTAATHETELKLRVPPGALRQVLASPLLRSTRRSDTHKLDATYFDTPALDLCRQHIALRVRREGRRWVQAVKAGGSVMAGVHQRLEFEVVVQDANPDVAALPRSPLTRSLQSRKIATALVPVFRTGISRTLRWLAPAPGTLIEVAIDRGLIRSGRRRQQVCEIELELKSGPVTALFDLAQNLVQAMPLALEHRSKAERGYALFRGRSAPPAKAAPVTLTPGMTIGQAFCAIVAAALAQVHANERGVIESDDSEYLHQMRVGLRRARSAFSLFRDYLKDDAQPHAHALRVIAGALGAARDWDVFSTQTLPAVHAALAAHGVAETFEQRCREQREAAHRRASKFMRSTGYLTSLIALGRWLAAQQDAANGATWAQPVRTGATRILAQHHARVLKRGRHLGRRTPAELHRLRIAVKQLRYAVEFFSALYPARSTTVFRGRLARLQDILGRMNDAAVVEPLLGTVAATGGDSAAAVGMVIGWCEAHAAMERDALSPAWRRFRAAPGSWRE